MKRERESCLTNELLKRLWSGSHTFVSKFKTQANSISPTEWKLLTFYSFLMVNTFYDQTPTNNECNPLTSRLLCVYQRLIYLIPLCHWALLLKTHQWNTHLHWVMLLPYHEHTHYTLVFFSFWLSPTHFPTATKTPNSLWINPLQKKVPYNCSISPYVSDACSKLQFPAVTEPFSNFQFFVWHF